MPHLDTLAKGYITSTVVKVFPLTFCVYLKLGQKKIHFKQKINGEADQRG